MPNIDIMRLMAQAVMYGQSGRYDEAVRLLTQALRLDPNEGELYHNRGMAYSFMEKYDEALADFNRAIALDPHPMSYEQRGLVYSQKGDKASARRDWEQALSMDPQSTFSLVNMGNLTYMEGQLPQALGYFTRAITLEPTMATAYARRARVYYDMNEMQKAYADMQKARELVERGLDTSGQDKLG